MTPGATPGVPVRDDRWFTRGRSVAFDATLMSPYATEEVRMPFLERARAVFFEDPITARALDAWRVAECHVHGTLFAFDQAA